MQSAMQAHFFIQELGIPTRLEWDERGESSIRALTMNGNRQVIGSSRLLFDGYIGRNIVITAGACELYCRQAFEQPVEPCRQTRMLHVSKQMELENEQDPQAES